MRPNFSDVAKIFFSPETLFPFLIGTIFLSVLSNAVTQILFSWLGTSVKVSIGIALGAVCIFALSVWLFGIGLSRLRQKTEVKLDKVSPAKRRGLILLVSRPEPCRKAINYHIPLLECVWLICSQETLTVAQNLQQEFAQLKIPAPIVVNDIYDPLDFYKCVKKIYKNLPDSWNIADVIADYTGMTAHGSVGMVLASLGGQYSLQYTPAEIDKTTQKPTGRSLSPIEIALYTAQDASTTIRNS
ncbi:CRISPR-associated protein [Komarekiella sp. 'clone 1']|uniref:CRISPR-associated protein n=1 Tax=Komarekiella delphini-convector SJRDD-AB1 TaxID=2593771 RepID=A0AA40T4D9_9NOST|nr:CRISPR-associated protein [Komarekiella delphini-convector]MBD6620458.1 CRISPR-associated protein [Komarekiella delphini-convector SJRDD-AB1]